MDNSNNNLKKDFLESLSMLETGKLPNSSRVVREDKVKEYLKNIGLKFSSSSLSETSLNKEDFKIFNSKKLLKKEVNKFPYLIDKLIPEKAITSITADSGKGKSLIALEIANCISMGKKLFDEFETKKKKVLIVDQEMDFDLIISRIKSMLIEETNIDFMIEQFWQIDNPKHYKWMLDLIKQNDYRLIIFDTLTTIHSKDENSSKEMRLINQLLLKLIADSGTTLVYLHHHRKQGKGEAYNQSSSRGSTEIIAKVASHILIDSRKKFDDNGNSFIEMSLSQEKARRPDGISRVGVNIIYDSNLKKTYFEYLGEVDQISDSIKKAETFVMEILTKDPSKFSIKLLSDKAAIADRSIRERAVRMACKELADRDVIKTEKGDGKFWNTNFYFIPLK